MKEQKLAIKIGKAEKEIESTVMDVALEVHKNMGLGFGKDEYCRAMAHEFELESVPFERDKNIEYQEKELLVCESCGAVITTKEHLHFMHRKLGPKAFASILNLNLLNQKLRLTEEQDVQTDIKDGLKRKDMFSIICPNCLRQVLVKYLFKSA